MQLAVESLAFISTLVEDELPLTQFFALFNKICYQLEVENQIEEETEKNYVEVAKTMDENLVKGFRTEIDKLKKKYMTSDQSTSSGKRSHFSFGML